MEKDACQNARYVDKKKYKFVSQLMDIYVLPGLIVAVGHLLFLHIENTHCVGSFLGHDAVGGLNKLYCRLKTLV